MADSPLVQSLTPSFWQEFFSSNGSLIRAMLGAFPTPPVQPASSTPYTPGDASDWNPVPSQVAQALDLLAFPCIYQQLNAAPQNNIALSFGGTVCTRRKSGLFACIAVVTGTNAGAAPQNISATLSFSDNGPPGSVFAGVYPSVAAGSVANAFTVVIAGVRQAVNTTPLQWFLDLSNSVPSNLSVTTNRCNMITLEF